MISMTWPQYRRQECSYKGWRTILSPLEAEVLLVLLLRNARATTIDVLIEAVWGDDPNGGPADANCAIRGLIHVLRRKVPGVIGGGPGFGYHLHGARKSGRTARHIITTEAA